MNIFKNKYFLFGNLAFLLIVIPVALYFLKNQTHTRGSAAALTTISFNPPNLSTSQCTNTTTSVVLDPGQNVVNYVKLVLTWDASKFDVTFDPNKGAFDQILDGPTNLPNGGGLSVTMTNSDVTNAITTVKTIGTLTIKPLSPTNGTPVTLNVDPSTVIKSLSTQDNVSENVLKSADKLGVAITADTCTTTSPSPSPNTDQVSPTLPPASSTTPTVTPVPSGTTGTNILPVCSNLTATPNSGYAPLNVSFTANGSDSDGTITQATFDYGDGSTPQIVTAGMGTATVSAQTTHTYNNGATFNATVKFTDNNSGVSSTCTQQIAVGGPVTPTSAPTAPPQGGSGGGQVIATATPTIANPGGVTTTIGIIGGVVIAIVGGLFLLVL